MNCPECEGDVIEGTCRSCGLVVDDTPEMLQPVRDYDHEEAFQYGDPRTHRVPDMSMMTYTDSRDRCDSPELRRALQADGYFGWNIEKTIRLNSEMNEICAKLNLNKNFLSECYYFLRKYRDDEALKGKELQHVAPALIYLLVRMYSEAYILFDFEELGYNSQRIYRYYTEFVRNLNLYNKIKPYDPLIFVTRLVNSVLGEVEYIIKYNLMRWVVFYFKGLLNRLEETDHLLVFDNDRGFYIICASIYMAVSDTVPKYKVAEKSNCSLTTLSNYIYKIKKLQDFDNRNVIEPISDDSESEYFKQFTKTASNYLSVSESAVRLRVKIGKSIVLKEFDDKSKELYNKGLKSHIELLSEK